MTKNDWRNVGWNDKNSFGALMKKCYWVSTEITFGPSYKVLLLCDSCHQNMMINMIGTVLAKAATSFRFLLQKYRFCSDFWQRQDLTQAANTLLHCQWFIPPLGILFDLGIYIFLEFKMLSSNDAFELLEFWFLSGSGNSYCSSLPMIYFLD